MKSSGADRIREVYYANAARHQQTRERIYRRVDLSLALFAFVAAAGVVAIAVYYGLRGIIPFSMMPIFVLFVLPSVLLMLAIGLRILRHGFVSPFADID